ncbi:DUF4347 domain-containing protein [Nostoc sp.]|uniref:DUF4347 domain-containing protein n=1 Tax=Nostoc sp. TaxID=1180 RepID=UPI002FFA4664
MPDTKIIFIDGNVLNYQSLIDNISVNSEVVVLNPESDGIEQITRVLAGRKNIDSIHIISHGDAGTLEIGTNILNHVNLQAYSHQLQQWGQALTDNGDILLYGCNVAEGEVGLEFVQQLSNLTGADIAASTDLTGSTNLGGDWQLEVATGEIEAQSALAEEVRNNYAGVLKIFQVMNTNNDGTNSLRQAILDAGNSAGLDVIDLTGVSGTISLNSSLPTLNAGNDIFITGNNNITIDGKNQYQIIAVNGANVGFEGVTFKGGKAKGGDATNGGGGGLVGVQYLLIRVMSPLITSPLTVTAQSVEGPMGLLVLVVLMRKVVVKVVMETDLTVTPVLPSMVLLLVMLALAAVVEVVLAVRVTSVLVVVLAVAAVAAMIMVMVVLAVLVVLELAAAVAAAAVMITIFLMLVKMVRVVMVDLAQLLVEVVIKELPLRTMMVIKVAFLADPGVVAPA